MELSVLQMGNRKSFVAVVVFIVDWDDPYSEEHLTVVEHFFFFCGKRREGLRNQQLTQRR